VFICIYICLIVVALYILYYKISQPLIFILKNINNKTSMPCTYDIYIYHYQSAAIPSKNPKSNWTKIKDKVAYYQTITARIVAAIILVGHRLPDSPSNNDRVKVK